MNNSSDLKFVKEGFMNIIDKLVSSQNTPALSQTWSGLKKKLEGISAFEIYLESQKFNPQEINREAYNITPQKKSENAIANTQSARCNRFSQKSLLSEVRQAQNDIKLGTSQFASIFNLTSESAQSTVMDAQQFHHYVQISKQTNQFKEITIYVPQSQNYASQPRQYYASRPLMNQRFLGSMESILQNNNRADSIFYKWQGC